MIIRKFKTILEAWHGLIKELSYGDKCVVSGRIVSSFPDILCVEIANVAIDEGLHIGLSSYTTMRWNKFLRRYFRPDLASWVDATARELDGLNNKYQVAGYSIEPNPETKIVGRGNQGGHRHGACLASLQIQSYPSPRVVVMSRAAQIDRAGFLDLCMMHLVAKRTGWGKVRGVWIVSNASITACNQLFYTRRFHAPLEEHHLGHCIKRFTIDDWRDSKYGPQKRMLKRAEEVEQFGEVPRSSFVKDLSLEFEERKR